MDQQWKKSNIMSESKDKSREHQAAKKTRPTTSEGSTNVRKREKLQLDPEEYSLRKRLPERLPRGPNEIYVNNHTDFKAQLTRAFKCLETEDCIHVHGLGAAVARAINLALQLQEKSKVPLETSVNTSTVKLFGNISIS